MPPSTSELLRLAEPRWQALATAHPELAAPVALQRRLITRQLAIADRLDSSDLPTFALPTPSAISKLTGGIPLLRNEPIPIPTAELQPDVLGFCRDLEAAGAGAAAAHVAEAIAGGRLDCGSLLSASLSRNQMAIRMGAEHRGLAPDLLWLVAELSVGPLAHRLQHRHLADDAEPGLRAALAAWGAGTCPACGSWPAFAERAGELRFLRCSFCGARWPPPPRACLYCEAAAGSVHVDRPGVVAGQQVTCCDGCSGYLKTLDVIESLPYPLLAIEDLASAELDAAAAADGYERPSLPQPMRPEDCPDPARLRAGGIGSS